MHEKNHHLIIYIYSGYDMYIYIYVCFVLCWNIYTIIYIIHVGYVIHISFYMKPCKSEINNDQHELAVRHCSHQHYSLPTFIYIDMCYSGIIKWDPFRGKQT